MAEQTTPERNKENEHVAERVFVAGQQYRELSARDEAKTTSIQNAGKGLLFNDLVFSVCCPATERAQAILKQVNSSLALRTQYLWILNRCSLSKSEEQIAASTTKELSKRETDRFILQLKPDPSVESQVYVLVQLKGETPATQLKFASDTAHEHGIFLHCLLQDAFYVLRFPSFSQGKTQVLIERDSKIFSVLSDAETHIFLQK